MLHNKNPCFLKAGFFVEAYIKNMNKSLQNEKRCVMIRLYGPTLCLWIGFRCFICTIFIRSGNLGEVFQTE